jgi:hypothetical protein
MIPRRYFFQTSSTSMTVLIEEKWRFGKLKVEKWRFGKLKVEIPFSTSLPCGG